MDSHSKRTKEGIAKARTSGTAWGTHGAVLAQKNRAHAQVNAEALRPILFDICTGIRVLGPGDKICAKKIAEELNTRGYSTQQGNDWHPTTVRRVINRLGPDFHAEVKQATDALKKAKHMSVCPDDGEKLWETFHQQKPQDNE